MDSAVEYLRKMNAGEISAVELVTEVIGRIETVNPALNAVVAMDKEQSLAQAKLSDAERAKTGPRPLLGLPITVKDSIDVKGFRCTGGSYARENHWPEEDASVVARLRSAGAIIIGKTNLPEYSSSYETDNALFGRTNNPADLERTPGGSTGGEAALLGADATLVGIGVDGGGSIRVPSHYCGTVGIRPTVGRTPDTGHWPVTRDTGYRDMMCLGPMARYVEDLALLLPIISGADGVDPYAVSVALGDPATVDLKGLRIGYYFDDGVAKVSQETEHGIKAAALALKESGADVVEIEPQDSREATMLFFTMVGADGGASTWRDLEGSDGRHHHQFQTLLDGFGESLSVTDFFELQRRYFEMRANIRRSVAAYDAILCPVTTGPAPLHMEPPHGVPGEDYFKYEGFNYVHSYAVAGLPSTVVPIAEQDGMPLGVQVVASAYQEHVSLAVAAKLESMLGGFVPRMVKH